ncbi:rRNA-processing protein FCF1 homolog [Watersipora subatra]|uniref:rRNA-processing protein FCF1 homolog n=1 Tax=Watersipora subatra TaxID=2589382 RepID=UPI00355C6FBD
MPGANRQKKAKKIALKKSLKTKLISLNDSRLKDGGKISKRKLKKKKNDSTEMEVKKVKPITSAMFFAYNTKLGPPYHVLVDTNFINLSLKNKLDVHKGIMDCLYAKCTCYITDCVLAELEKLGPKYKMGLRAAKDTRFKRLPCLHKGTYADDCLIERVTQHKCYIVASCDKGVRNRVRRIPGVPILYISNRKYTIERMPDAFGAPKV